MNKTLLLVWSFLDFLYIGSAIVCFVFALAWRGFGEADLGQPDFLLRRLVVSQKDTTAALVLGSAITLSFLFSIFALLHTRRSGTKTTVLSIFNATVIFVGIATLSIGCAVWFFTLRPRAEFAAIWTEQTPTMQAWLQDNLQCCGYWNASSAGLFTSNTGFCGTAEVAANATVVQPCVTPITAFEDSTLNSIFTTIYGFVSIEIALFLATSCLRLDKLEEERFRKIDEKRGTKGGFV